MDHFVASRDVSLASSALLNAKPVKADKQKRQHNTQDLQKFRESWNLESWSLSLDTILRCKRFYPKFRRNEVVMDSEVDWQRHRCG